MSRKGNILLPILAVSMAFIFVALVSFYAGQRYFQTKGQITNGVITKKLATSTDNREVGWKTYANDTFGFSVSFPSDKNFEISENKDGEIFIMAPQSDYGFVVRKIGNSRGLSAQDMAVEGIVNSGFETNGRRVVPSDYTLAPVTIGGEAGVEVSGPAPSYLLIPHSDSIWKISGFTLEKSLFDKILSTFKFISTANLDSNAETYTSQSLGLSFTYLTKTDGDDGYTIAVKEEGNKIYVYQQNNYSGYKEGQWVEVFSKGKNETLADAVKKKFLTNYSPRDCFVNASPNIGPSKHPSNFQVATISVPTSGDEGMDTLSEKWNKCPTTYTTTNGLSYFLMDPSHPDKFLYFSIGQYGIGSGETGRFWQDTIRFL